MFAHQHGVVTRGTQGLGIMATPDPGFGDLHEMRRNERPHAHCPFLVDGEGHEVTLVHPDHGRPCTDCGREFGLVVDLHQGVDVHLSRNVQHLAEFGSRQSSGDQQDTICTHDARVAHVPGIDGEVLPDDGKVARGASRLKVSH
ncbi:MAG: hypothetical protein RL430_1744 [Actinomycetota bacterium]